MIEFYIANLKLNESEFTVPAMSGAWRFRRREDYDNILARLEDGQCAATFVAANEAITHETSDGGILAAIDELIDNCLILSFLSASCVTPHGCSRQSDAQIIAFGDSFVRPRAISGFAPLNLHCSLDSYFEKILPAMARDFTARRLRLFLSHWISGLTCFALEDLFLSIGVQMDIVKQCEIVASGRKMGYYEGMMSASSRYAIPPLSKDFTSMRNDIIHEGVLSGANFQKKDKRQCAVVVAESLNWIDRYVSAILSRPTALALPLRWSATDLEQGLPALSLRA